MIAVIACPSLVSLLLCSCVKDPSPLCTLLPADRPFFLAECVNLPNLTLLLLFQAKDLPTFKDNDFLNEGQKLHVGEESKKNFLEKLKRDVEVSSNLFVFSLFVGQRPL